jgi:hypothetical protein
MHKCPDGSQGQVHFEKDVEKFIHRWNLHPVYAEALNSWYQNLLIEFETFSDDQAEKIHEEDSFGRSKKESAAIVTGLMNELKLHAREWMNKHAGVSTLQEA